MKYNGKEVKILKDYGNWILIETQEGFKEGINKQDLGLVIQRQKESEGRLHGITGLKV